jgi:predicted DNA-binding protein with PD1-like motif
MNYMKTGNVYIIRIDRGEEIVKAVNDICQKENITLGSLSGLGAVDRAKLGLYSIEKQEYIVNEFEGEYEITSLIGNVTTKDGVPYLHMHMTIGDITGAVAGGHLSEAHVSATCEIVIRTAEGTIERELNSAIGLNTMVFPESSS